MRLINTATLQFEEFEGDELPRYAILSHRWGEGEVLFKHMIDETAYQKVGYEKLQRCCRQAYDENIHYVWIDTCCIDKTSSAELSEAINSMFRLYQDSWVCYVHLSDVHVKYDNILLERLFKLSVWFTRGWTLQEMIAPQRLQFFNARWERLGGIKRFEQAIVEITTVPADILNHKAPLEGIPVAQRMSWAAGRNTTRVEDRAYSLMGIFGINMPMLYGEGKNSFRRLQEEIIKRSNDTSILFWDSPSPCLLAPSPSAFRICSSHNDREVKSNIWLGTQDLSLAEDDLQPYGLQNEQSAMTNTGLAVSLPIFPWFYNTYIALVTVIAPFTPSAVYCFIYLAKGRSGARLFRISWKGHNIKCLTHDQFKDGPLSAMYNEGLDTHARQIVIAPDCPPNLLHLDFSYYQVPTAGRFRLVFEPNPVWGPTNFPEASEVITRNPWDAQCITSGSTPRKLQFQLCIQAPRELLAVIRVTLPSQEKEFLFLGFDKHFNPFVVLAEANDCFKASDLDRYAAFRNKERFLRDNLNPISICHSLDDMHLQSRKRRLVYKGKHVEKFFEDLELCVSIEEGDEPGYNITFSNEVADSDMDDVRDPVPEVHFQSSPWDSSRTDVKDVEVSLQGGAIDSRTSSRAE